MTTDILKARLESINKKCEEINNLKLNKLYIGSGDEKSEFSTPSPQVLEALWFDLINSKEHEFIKEIRSVLNKVDTNLSKENICTIEEIINDIFSDDQYLERMSDFYKKFNKKTALNGPSFDSAANKLDLINSAYQEGITKVLQKARNHVLAELILYKKNEPRNLDILTQWRKYSTLNPLRAIGTIILLYCTSLLIAWIIKGETFQRFLQYFGWSVGSG